MITDPILFITGAPRSGTTFLNAVIRDVAGYGLCAEGDFVPYYARRLGRYGHLRTATQVERLVHDICDGYMLRHFRQEYSKHLGRPVEVTAKMVIANISEPTFAGVIYAVFKCVAEEMHLPNVGNKNPDYYRILPELATWFPNARFLNIVRDGRDVALSTIAEKSWGEKSVWACARKWSAVLQAHAEAMETFASGRLLTVRYEDLLQRPEQIFPEIFSFLGQALSDEDLAPMVGHFRSRAKAGNFDKWRKAMSPRDIALYEGVAGDWLRTFGYDTRSSHRRPVLSTQVYYASGELVRRTSQRFGW